MMKDTGSSHLSNPSFSMFLFSSPYLSLHGQNMATIASGMSSAPNSIQAEREGEED